MQRAMAKVRPFRIEAAGWGFWAVTAAILFGPCIYLANTIIEEHHTWDVPTLIGFVFATVASAVITVVVNTILQRNAARRRAADKSRKRK